MIRQMWVISWTWGNSVAFWLESNLFIAQEFRSAQSSSWSEPDE